MGMLFCVGKDGNRAAGKMLNRCALASCNAQARRSSTPCPYLRACCTHCARSLAPLPAPRRSFDIARHGAALLSASFKAHAGRYLGVRWSPFEAVLYVRVLAENEDFTDRLVRPSISMLKTPKHHLFGKHKPSNAC